MKKIIYTLLVAALIFATGNNTAQAAQKSDFKLYGHVLVGAQFGESYSVYTEEFDQSLYPGVLAQRVQFGMVWNANPNTSFNMFIRVPGEMTWGNNTRSKAFEADEYVATKVANVMWKPTDNFTIIMGRFFHRGPDHVGFVGSPIQSDFADGIRLLGNIGDSWAYDVTWGRGCTYGLNTSGDDFSYEKYYGAMVAPSTGADYNGDTGTASITYSDRPYNFDWFVYSATYKSDLFQIQPYGALTILGKDSIIAVNQPYNTNMANLTGDTTYIYWGGFTSKVKLDTLNFGIDAVWNGNQVDYHDGGYLVDAYIRKTMKNFNLGLFGWYANGNKEDQIAGLQTVCWDGILGHVNSKYLGWGLQPFSVGSGVGCPTGTTGVGFEFSSFKPIDGVPLTMNVNLSYINGTNHTDFVDALSDDGLPYNLTNGYASYLTTKDHVIDVGTSMLYQPSRNITLGFEVNYLMPHLGRDGAPDTKNGYHMGLVTYFNM